MDVAHSPTVKKNPTGSSKWSLDPSLEVSLRMKAVSSSTGDQKVSVAAMGWDVWEEVSRWQQVSCSVRPALIPSPSGVSFSLDTIETVPAIGILTDNTEMPEV